MANAKDYGFITPVNTDWIRDGDDAISHNAEVTASLADYLEALGAQPGSRRENVIYDPIPMNAVNTFTPFRCTLQQAPGYGRAICNDAGATYIVPQVAERSSLQWSETRIPLPTGSSVAFRMEVRGMPDQAMGAILLVRGYSLSGTTWTNVGTFVQTPLTQIPAGTSTVKLEGEGVIPDTITHIEMQLQFRRWGASYPEVGDYIYWRRTMMAIGAGVTLASTPYFDGNSYSARWLGAVNGSHSVTAKPRESSGMSFDAGAAHAALVDWWSALMGGVKRRAQITTASVRVDHGLKNFAAKLRPILEARNIPYTIALPAEAWGLAENEGITPAIVDSWATTGKKLCTIAAHGWGNHLDTSDETLLRKYIEGAKASLESDLPGSSPIHIFMPPGASGAGGYGGFLPSDSPAKYSGTFAGRLAMATYPICSGQFTGTAYRVQDGVPRLGQAYFNMDTFDAAGVMVRVNNAITNKTGIQLMIHPSLIDTAGHITTAQLTSLFDQLIAKQTAGQIALVSVSEQYLTATN